VNTRSVARRHSEYIRPLGWPEALSTTDFRPIGHRLVRWNADRGYGSHRNAERRGAR